jgi:PKD repeat protein
MCSLRAIPSLIFALAIGLAQAQLHPVGPIEERGGGTVQGCDSSLHVAFTAEITGPYSYVFSPYVTPGATIVTGNVWSWSDNSDSTLHQLYGEMDLPVVFPNGEEHVVCLTVNAIDAITQQPCSTTTCDLFQPLADSSCISLVPDFTISAIDGSTVTFMDLSSFAAGVQGTYWSFGDGMSTAEVTPSHTFYGPGPFEVCLTVQGPGPVYCTATVCKWLYLGPAGVPCGTVLEQGFLFLQQDNVVGVLDTSFTAGMNTNITWDFGDGYTAEGNVAVHAYSMGAYELCSTVRVWGPLTTDTCTSTMCRTVDAFLGTAIEGQETNGPLHAWPNPFSEELAITGLEAGVAHVRIHDACGRSVYQALAQAGPLVTLDLSQLAAGTYTLHCMQGGRTNVVRAMKR